MRRLALLLAVLSGVLAMAALQSPSKPAHAQGRPPGGPGPGVPMFAPVPGDSFASERDSLMNAVLKQIAGREDAPAESVFKNIKSMKGMPAGRLLRIMNFGYGRSLGVRCQHCHVADRWEAEDRPQKQIARDMMALVRTINETELTKIKNLQSEHPGVNCTTCHRGQRKPAMNM